MRIRDIFQMRGLRFKILAPILIMVAAITTISSLKFSRHERSEVSEAFSSQGGALARNLAASAQDTLLTRDVATIQGFIDEYKGIPGVGYVYVVDDKGRILAHTFSPAFPEELAKRDRQPRDLSTRIVKSALVWQERHFLDIEAPILAGTMGFAHIGMDMDIAERKAATEGREAFGESLFVGAFLLSTIFFLIHQSTRKIIRLSRLSRNVATGGSFELPTESSLGASADGDEISVLAANFLGMVRELDDQRKNLEGLVEARTLKLRNAIEGLRREARERQKIETALHAESLSIALLQQATIIANAAPGSEVAIKSILRLVAEFFGFAFGQAYFLSENPNSYAARSDLAYQAKAFDPQHLNAMLKALKDGDGLVKKVLATGEPYWVRDIHRQRELEMPTLPANAMGLKGALAFPVSIDFEIGAILEFFSEDVVNPGHQHLKILRSIGIQIGHILSRERAQRKIEQQRTNILAAAKMSSLGEMAGGVAHEINNPLATIKTISNQLEELLAAGNMDKVLFAERLSKLTKTTDRIAKIVLGLRSFSRDGSKDSFQPVNLRELVEETVSFSAERFRNHGTSLTVEMIPENLSFEGRQTQISQVLLNLLNNAFDAISRLEKRWVKISIVEESAHVEIRVTDSGKGIPPEVQKKLFQPFFTTKEIGKGTGMGLSISLGIVRSHHGELKVDFSCPNTCFVIRLPKKLPSRSGAPGSPVAA